MGCGSVVASVQIGGGKVPGNDVCSISTGPWAALICHVPALDTVTTAAASALRSNVGVSAVIACRVAFSPDCCCQVRAQLASAAAKSSRCSSAVRCAAVSETSIRFALIDSPKGQMLMPLAASTDRKHRGGARSSAAGGGQYAPSGAAG